MYLLIRLSLFLLLLLIPTIGHSACTWTVGDTVGTAASCSQADVKDCLDDAECTDGNTVNIPAGDCTWTSSSPVTISGKGILLQGAGEGVTNITASGSDKCLLVDDASDTRLTAFTWLNSSYTGTYGAIRIQGDTLDWRIDNITFTDQNGHRLISIFQNAYRGLVDNCDFTITYSGSVHIRLNTYKGSSKGEEFWLEDIDWGGTGWIFVEDNVFHRTGSGSYLWAAVDCDGPGKYVFRHNDCMNTKVINHGYDYNQCLRGGRGIDIYNNTFDTDEEDIDTYRAGYVMGGTAMVHDNVYSTGYYGYAFGPYAPRVGYAGGCNSHKCDGTQDEDGNSGVGDDPGYPCRDQPGRGMDSGASLGAGEPWDGCFLEDQALEPMYEWNNTWSDESDMDIDAPWIPTDNRDYIVENRDYYNYDPTDTPWAGTDGVGVGTQVARPATCTAGVAYWDTTNSQLDKCTATNTWTEGVYETYTYPHPLRDEGTAEASGSVYPGGCQEPDIVSGEKTIVITLSGAEWESDIGTDCDNTTALIAGLDSDKAEAGGWDLKIKAVMDFNEIVRTSDTVVTITLDAYADYQITANETITITVPAQCTSDADAIVCTPTFQISAEQVQVETISAVYDANGPTVVYDANGPTVN